MYITGTNRPKAGWRSHRWWRYVGLAVALGTLVLGFVVTIRFRLRYETQTPPVAALVVPALRAYQPRGWSTTELPLSETELGSEMVSRTLRYDDFTYLHFRNGPAEFTIYVAYWSAGKVDLRTVNAHTPDTCWGTNGWTATEARDNFRGFTPGTRTAAGQLRSFVNGGTMQHVAFWHLLDGRAVEMWRYGFPKLTFMWRLFGKEHRSLGGEQFFVRIASSRPLSEIWSEPALQGVFERLQPSGLVVSGFNPAPE
ncbi:hypothetical protein Oter_3450 [Opitutus terrae PB90-1]|uniref:Methanolan biosynthesis EpsI domain-containing protein n=1 Tax=Opitutus terrae (strain DSM 11246 / JCM 15787 / PB90-1) TaxID=452637 RepID=B1ZV60_OPITP|nr:hypothetical protein Oter_3450 [Opitutus terrae PB90-1]